MYHSNSPPPHQVDHLSLQEFLRLYLEIKTKLERLETKVDKLLDPDPLQGYISEDEAKVKFKRGTTWFWSKRQEGLPSVKVGSTNYYPTDKLLQFFTDDNE